MRNIITIALALVIIALGYLLFNSIQEPIRFDRVLKHRNSAIVTKMKDIREAQNMYKKYNGKFTSDFDTLFAYVKNGKIPVEKLIPDPDDTTFTKTIREVVGEISVQDSLFGHRPNFVLEDLAVIPNSNGQRFVMETDMIDKGGVQVSVLEVKVPYEVYLHDLDPQAVLNQRKLQESIFRYPGIKMGSLTDASTDGNWE